MSNFPLNPFENLAWRYCEDVTRSQKLIIFQSFWGMLINGSTAITSFRSRHSTIRRSASPANRIAIRVHEQDVFGSRGFPAKM
jgi:hypothetical protein